MALDASLLSALRSSLSAGVTYPKTGLHFELSLLTFSLGNFREISGLSCDMSTEDYHEGGINYCTYKLPTGSRHGNLVLRAGLGEGRFLWAWYSAFSLTSKVVPIPLQLRLKNPDGSSARTWIINNAFPIKWEGPTLNAQEGAVAIETLELAHQGIWG
jgi:phage tail-like protein